MNKKIGFTYYLALAVYLVFFLLLALGGVGCSHVTEIGRVGNLRFYKIQATSFLGPSQTVIASTSMNDTNNVVIVGQAAGNGIGPALVGAAGNVAGSYVFGKSLRPDHVDVQGGIGIGTGGEASASGGNATGGNGGNGGAGGHGGSGGFSGVEIYNPAPQPPPRSGRGGHWLP